MKRLIELLGLEDFLKDMKGIKDVNFKGIDKKFWFYVILFTAFIIFFSYLSIIGG